MDPARTGVNIVILAACRSNPVPGAVRSAAQGLARMEGPRGTLVAYATAPGAVAADGPPGGNSPYTLALASTLPLPGLAAEEVFRTVRQQVLAVTGEAQVPWESSSLTRAFYFAPRAATGAEAAAGR
jgi:uncharacterized caspase-like protein